MFEIGSSLRAARMRQQLELSQVERATRIRARYLAALEDERFDVLPGAAYAKGFLRTYADFLGLDAQRFVDEYNSRFAPSEEEPQPAPPVRIRRPRRKLGPWLLAVPAAAAIALLVWGLTGTSGRHAASRPPPTHTRVSKPAPAPAPHPAAGTPTTARIVLVAARGRCWISVHLGSATGTFVYAGTLEQGQSARFVAPRLWIRLGAPWNLDATLNGKAVQLPGSIGDVIVTPSGLATT